MVSLCSLVYDFKVNDFWELINTYLVLKSMNILDLKRTPVLLTVSPSHIAIMNRAQ